jgi:hypothetical protein
MSDYIQVANVSGNQEDEKTNMVKDNFYILCRKNPKNNIGLRRKGLITFSDKITNIEYLCSDLVRFCLALYKNNLHNDGGSMSLIPKQPIPISEELEQYIREYIPDYYGIRK